MTRLLMAMIRAYQLLLSPLLGPACRYQPTCSEYAKLCIRDHGPIKGCWLGLKRILRCHPFAGFGYDPPPPPASAKPLREASKCR